MALPALRVVRARPPGRTGPAEDAPLVLRGKALRDAFILRLLAAERGIRGVLLVALAYGVYRFDGAQDSLQRVFDEYLPAPQARSPTSSASTCRTPARSG